MHDSVISKSMLLMSKCPNQLRLSTRQSVVPTNRMKIHLSAHCVYLPPTQGRSCPSPCVASVFLLVCARFVFCAGVRSRCLPMPTTSGQCAPRPERAPMGSHLRESAMISFNGGSGAMLSVRGYGPVPGQRHETSMMFSLSCAGIWKVRS